MLTLASGDIPYLSQAVWIIVAAAVVAYICFHLKLVPIVGFLLAGVLLGPDLLELVNESEVIQTLADVGVVLLLFTIGIEFSLDRLWAVRSLIFGAGGLQVGLTLGATMLLLVPFGISWQDALFTGCLVSLSSTAIVLKLLAGTKVNTPLGQVSVGVLIFQDLAVVAMVLLVPMLGTATAEAADVAAAHPSGAGGVAWALAKAAGMIIGVLVVARKIMPLLLERVARTCSPEIFLLSLVAICLGTASLCAWAGLSPALGAFLAGLTVSESRYSHHALGEIMPLQILFSAVFFVSVGLLLNLSYVSSHPWIVMSMVGGIVVLKFITTFLGVKLMGRSTKLAAAAGLMLGQVGEFSFVLLTVGTAAGLNVMGISPREIGGKPGYDAFLAASVILMVLTPLLSFIAQRLAGGARDDTLSPLASHEGDHIIIDGFGERSRALSQLLRAELPLTIITLNPDFATQARALGLATHVGATDRQTSLSHAGLDRAAVVVIADDDADTTERAISHVRTAAEVREGVRIIVFAETHHDVADHPLLKAGADVVVSPHIRAIERLADEVRHAFALVTSRTSEQLPLPEHLDDCKADDTTDAPRQSAGCLDCLATGTDWVHLRMNRAEGRVGCCDSSPSRHARKYAQASDHKHVRSLEPGERWHWCFRHESPLR